MSKTIVDLPKVAQMLDSGWKVKLFKNRLGTYSAMAKGPAARVREALERLWGWLHAQEGKVDQEWEEFWLAHCCNGYLITDDFTPEQALTRLAYKVHGEII